ncbi:MAG: hypothetical protein K2N18_02190 [Clostridia bacterium]|nr:hypothetical protein [Clostridia bacterium]
MIVTIFCTPKTASSKERLRFLRISCPLCGACGFLERDEPPPPKPLNMVEKISSTSKPKPADAPLAPPKP